MTHRLVGMIFLKTNHLEYKIRVVCGPEEAGETDLLGSGGGSGDFA